MVQRYEFYFLVVKINILHLSAIHHQKIKFIFLIKLPCNVLFIILLKIVCFYLSLLMSKFNTAHLGYDTRY